MWKNIEPKIKKREREGGGSNISFNIYSKGEVYISIISLYVERESDTHIYVSCALNQFLGVRSKGQSIQVGIIRIGAREGESLYRRVASSSSSRVRFCVTLSITLSFFFPVLLSFLLSLFFLDVGVAESCPKQFILPFQYILAVGTDSFLPPVASVYINI